MNAPELGLLAAAATVVTGSVAALVPGWWRHALALQCAGMAAAGALALAVLAGAPHAGAAFRDGVAPAVGVDGLSAFFLLVVAAVAVPATLFARDALDGTPRPAALAALTGGFCLALGGLVAARDVTTFLACWELVTLLPASAILVARHDPPARRAVFAYLAMTHLGGAGVWLTLAILAGHGGLSGDGAPLGGGTQAVVAVAALLGFLTKAGAMPLHSWLPRAHPIAPPHLSALMSAAMVSVALYGLVRVLFEWAAPMPLWVGLVLLAIGALSAVGGVLYALVQRELKRLLAFSTIENVGIVLLGLGAAVVLDAVGEPRFSALAFAAALAHVLNHALLKTLLFLAAGAIARAAGGLELDRLGGLLRRMPWTAGAFAVGAIAIAGVPPLNGFASEWMTLQALLHVALDGSIGVALAGAVALAALAATAALGALCFVSAVGLVALGAPREAAAATAVEAPRATRGALLLALGGCAALTVAPGLLVPTLAALGPGSASLTTQPALALPGSGGLPLPALLLALAAATALLARLAGTRRTGRAPTWTCGVALAPPPWTAAGFTKPLRLVLESVLRPRRDHEVRERAGVVQEVVFVAEVPHLFDTHLYDPVVSAAQRAAGIVRRLQSGSLRAYLLYLVALVAVLLLAVRSGVLG